MSIYKRRSGRYQVTVDLDPTATGARLRRSLGTFATKKEADRAEREALAQRDRGTELAPGTVTLAELVERFLKDRKAQWEPGTYERASKKFEQQILRHLPNMALAKFRPHHVNEWLTTLVERGGVTGKALSPKSVRTAFDLFNHCIRWGEKYQLVSAAFLKPVDPPRVPRKEASAYAADQMQRILSAAIGTKLEHAIRLALCTGVRRGELAALRWTDVRWEDRLLVVARSICESKEYGVYEKATKTNVSRIVPLSDDAMAALRAQKARQASEKLASENYKDSGHIFQEPGGGPLRLMHLTDGFRKLARRANVDVTRLHNVRHTTATWTISSGVDIATVAALLGHSTPSTTLNIYAHVMPKAKHEAVSAVDKMLRSAKKA